MEPDLTYPPARLEDVSYSLAGIEFSEPYGWLDEESDDTAEWQRAQNALTDEFVQEWPHLDRLRELVGHYVADGNGSPNWMVDQPPCFAGGKWFQLDRPGPDYPQQAVVTVLDELSSVGHVLYDPNPGGDRHVSWFAPSPDGRVVALGVGVGGSELGEVQLVDVATGSRLPDRIPQSTVGPLVVPQWLPDSSGFFYSAVDPSAGGFAFGAYLHRVGAEPATEAEPVHAPDVVLVQVAADGRHAVATGVWPLPRYICDLPGRAWRPFIQNVDASVAGVIDGDRFVAITNHGAARGRLVAVRIDSADPDDTQSWQELVPESRRVLSHVRLVGERLVVTGSVDTEARAWVFDREGRELEEVPLPGVGALPDDALPTAASVPAGHPDEFVFRFSSPRASPGGYRYRFGSGVLETVRAPAVTMPAVTIELRWASSADGTRVPYHVVLPDEPGEGPLPTLITAYGGGRVAWAAQFPGPLAAFVASGGALAISHQRGGSDLGSSWADDGRVKNKQNSYDDLYAIAEHLVSTGLSTADRLAVTGWSNGGIMAGTALTQRPELWAAVVAQSPLLDLIGAAHRYPYCRFAIGAEFGDLDDPDEVRRLTAQSPYQLVDDDTRYPWFYVHAGADDMACPTGPSRRFVARLQATAPAAPVLLRLWDGVGHGTASGRSAAMLHTSYWLAFIMRRLGMTPAGSVASESPIRAAVTA